MWCWFLAEAVCVWLLFVVQIDLTDDYVVVALFVDGAWEDKMQRLTARDDSGNLVDVVLDSDAFRDLISVME
jgi:hypothetical protein